MRTTDHKTSTPHAAEAADVQWRNDVLPVSRRFEDSYFSDVDGRAETRDVFLRGNGLPERWAGVPEFTVAELGFGTGLNFLETLAEWQQHAPASARLTYVSFEMYPMEMDALCRALSPWPVLAASARRVLAGWPAAIAGVETAHTAARCDGAEAYDGAVFVAATGSVDLIVYLGDARERIGAAMFNADAWYLDGFTPARNPELWNLDLLRTVCARTAAGGTFSTYTAAGWVRRNLEGAGFAVSRVAGFGRKRERLQGFKPAAANGLDRVAGP